MTKFYFKSKSPLRINGLIFLGGRLELDGWSRDFVIEKRARFDNRGYMNVQCLFGTFDMNIREEFLKSVEEESPETFLRFMEQHVSNVFMRSLMRKLALLHMLICSGYPDNSHVCAFKIWNVHFMNSWSFVFSFNCNSCTSVIKLKPPLF